MKFHLYKKINLVLIDVFNLLGEFYHPYMPCSTFVYLYQTFWLSNALLNVRLHILNWYEFTFLQTFSLAVPY